MAKISYEIKDKVLTISIDGKVDTNNATIVEKEVFDIISSQETNFDSFVLDADNLEYISSAGLRIILRLRKEQPTLKIINASTEVYNIFEMTGFSEMFPIEKGFRKLSIEGCTIIGKGAKGIIYRYDPETIIKAYINPESLPEIQQERNLARKAFVLGIPTAISYDVVKVGDSYGSVFELLDAVTYTELIKNNPDKIKLLVKECADLLRLIHSTKVQPTDMPSILPLIEDWLETDKPYLKEDNYNKLSKMISEIPSTTNMLHCDFHTNNIMSQNDEAILIDMNTLSYGNPIFELANIYITYVGFGEVNPSFVENFLGLPYDTAKKIWKLFLPLYLQTENPEKITMAEKKIKCLSYVRYMRHFVRRKDENKEEVEKIIKCCNDNLDILLSEIDSLVI